MDYFITLYHRTDCGWCVRFMPVWQEFVEIAHMKTFKNNKGENIRIVTNSVEANEKPEEVNAANVRGFPTIIYKSSRTPSETREFDRDRTVKDLFNFIEIKYEQESARANMNQSGGGSNFFYKKYLKYKSKYIGNKNK